MDLRGHGQTRTNAETDLSLDRLVEDVVSVIGIMCPSNRIVLIGHSLGGAVVVRAAPKVYLPFQK